MTRDDAIEAEDEFFPEVLLINVPSTAIEDDAACLGDDGMPRPRTVGEVMGIQVSNVTVPASGDVCRVDDGPDDEEAVYHPDASVVGPNTSEEEGHATAGKMSVPMAVEEAVHIQAANGTTPSANVEVEYRLRTGAMYADSSSLDGKKLQEDSLDYDKLQASSTGESWPHVNVLGAITPIGLCIDCKKLHVHDRDAEQMQESSPGASSGISAASTPRSCMT